MALTMQQPISLCQEFDSDEWSECEMPLALRTRRAWSADDVWVLRKACGEEIAPNPDCTSPMGFKLTDPIKFMDDTASTCADDDVSFTSEETAMEDSIAPSSPKLNWADEMQEIPAPKKQINPPGVWAVPSESFAVLPGQWTITFVEVSVPPGNLGSPLAPPGDLRTPPGKLCAPPGKFDAPMLPPGNFVSSSGKMTAPPGQLMVSPAN